MEQSSPVQDMIVQYGQLFFEVFFCFQYWNFLYFCDLKT